jgi:hypothetical protein
MMFRKITKGCPNHDCDKNRFMFHFKDKDDVNYCPECGTKLQQVCKSDSCYTFFNDPKRLYCAGCAAKRADKKEKGRTRVGASAATALTAGVVVTRGKDIVRVASKIIRL